MFSLFSTPIPKQQHVEREFLSSTTNGYSFSYKLSGRLTVKNRKEFMRHKLHTDEGKAMFLAAYQAEVFDSLLHTHFLSWGWAPDAQGCQKPILFVRRQRHDELITEPNYASLYAQAKRQNYIRFGAQFELVLFYVNSIPNNITFDRSHVDVGRCWRVYQRYPQVRDEELDVVDAVNNRTPYSINGHKHRSVVVPVITEYQVELIRVVARSVFFRRQE